MRQSFESLVKSKFLSDRTKDIAIARDFPNRYEEWLTRWASPEWREEKQRIPTPPSPPGLPPELLALHPRPSVSQTYVIRPGEISDPGEYRTQTQINQLQASIRGFTAAELTSLAEAQLARTPPDIVATYRENAASYRKAGIPVVEANFLLHEVGEKALLDLGVPPTQVHEMISRLFPAEEELMRWEREGQGVLPPIDLKLLGHSIVSLYPETTQVLGDLDSPERLQQAISSIHQLAQEDMDTFLQDLFEKGRSPESEYLMSSVIGATHEDIEQFYGGDGLEATLNKVMPGVSLDELGLMLEPGSKDFDTFVKAMQTGGRTKDKESLLRMIGVPQEDIEDILGVQRIVVPLDGIRRLVTVTADNRAFDAQGKWVGTYNPATREFASLPDEGIAKDFWDALYFGTRGAFQQTKQFFISVVPNFLFRDVGEVERKIYGDVWADKANAGNRQMRDTYRRVYAENQREFEAWRTKHPELQAKDNFFPQWMFEVVGSAPLTIAALAATATGVITKNPAAIWAGLAIMTPAQTQDVYESLLAAGASEDEAAQWAVPVGVVISGIEVLGDLPYLKAVSPTILRIFRGHMVREVSTEAVKSMGKKALLKGVKVGLQVPIIEGLEEGVQQGVQNAAVKAFDENKSLFENIAKSAAGGVLLSLPLGLIFGGVSMVRIAPSQTQGLTETEMKAKGWFQDPKNLKNWYAPIRGAAEEEIPEAIPPVTPGVVKEPWQMTREEFAKTAELFHGTGIEEARIIETSGFEMKPSRFRTGDIEGIYLGPKDLAKAYSIQTSSPIWRSPEFFDLIPISQRRLGATIPLSIKPGVKIFDIEVIPTEVLREGPKAITNYARKQNIKALKRGDEIIALDIDAIQTHSEIIRHALSEGKPVPPEVLADYPDLAKVAPKAEAAAEEVVPKPIPPVTPRVAKKPPQLKTYEVIVTQGVIKPKGGVEGPFERTFTVQAKTPAAAVKAVRDSGIKADKITVSLRPSARVEPVAPGVAKEPWQMTRAEAREYSLSNLPSGYRLTPTVKLWSNKPFMQAGEKRFQTQVEGVIGLEGVSDSLAPFHKDLVKQALSEGKPVPPEVLADYPDLARAVLPAEAVRPVAPEAALPVKEVSPAEMEAVMKLRQEAGLEGPPPGVRVKEEVVPPPARPPTPPVEEGVALPPPEGATKRVFDRISFEVAEPEIREKLTQGFHKFQVKMIDDLVAIKKFTQVAKTGGMELSIEENPYMLARLLKGVNSKATVFLEQGTFGKTFWKVVKGKATPNFTGESLEAILQEVKEPAMWQDFSTYLVARRSVELAARNIETGITEADAKATINELEAQHLNFPNLAERVYRYQDSLLVYGREMGLLSDDLLVKLRKYGNYVPFYRVFNELQAKGFMGKKMADIASPIKKIKGSEREILNPLESIVKNTYVLINAADRNRVGIMMANLVDINPELADVFERVKTPMARVAAVSAEDLGVDIEGLSVEDAEKVVDIFRPSFFVRGDEVTVLINGKKAFFKVDPDLRDALLALDREDIGMIGKFLSMPAKWLRAGATLSPDFMVRNPARDQLTAFAYSNYGFLPGVDFLRGVAGIIRKDADYQLFKLSGAEHSMLVSLDRQYLQTTFDEIVKGKKFTNYVKHPLELLQIISELGEKATRLGEFKAGIRRGAVPLEAGFSARNVTLDFAQSGTTAHAVNRLIAFFNANIRGQTKMLSAFKEHPVRTSAKVFGGITLPSLLLYFANRDDERWKEIPQWQKDLFWIVMTDDHIYRIPKPFELGILFGSVPERFLEWLDTKNPKMMKGVLEAAWEAGTPGFLPTAILPVIENMANYSFFRGTAIVPASRKDMPPELQYTQWTSEVSKKLGELLKVSPAKIDNLINGWTGGLGRYAVDILDKVLKGTGISPDIPEPSPTLADRPVIKAFVVRSPYGSSGQTLEDFYSLLEKYEAGEKYLKEMLTQGEQGKFEAYKAARPELLFFYDFEKGTSYSASARYLRKVGRELTEIRKKEDEVYRAKNISPDEKRRLIDQMEKLKTEVSRRALDLFPGREEPRLLQQQLSEAEKRLGEVLSDVPLLSLDDPEIYDMRKLSTAYENILELIKVEDLEGKEGISQTVFAWYEMKLSKASLKHYVDSHADKTKAKSHWLKYNPEDNARLALWGQERIHSQAAYGLMVKWSKELGVSLQNIDSQLPPERFIEDYFALNQIISDTSGSSIEARLFKLEHPEYLKWGLEQGIWTDDLSGEKIEALRLQVKLKGMMPDTPEYVETSRRIEAYRLDVPEDLLNTYMEYYTLPLGKARTDFRRKHPDLDAWGKRAGTWK